MRLYGGGRKGDSGKLKAAITGNTIWVESKEKDKIEIPNYRKFIAASNERYALPLDPDDRRWLVLECSGHNVSNKKYFDNILEELNNGGYEALLYELQRRNLSKFNPRKLPINDNAFDLKLQCAPSFLQYLYTALTEEKFNLDSTAGFPWRDSEIVIRTDLLRDYYRAFCLKEKLTLQNAKECGWVLKNLFKGTSFKKGRKRFEASIRQEVYAFPAISTAKERLANYFHISNIDVIFPEEEEI